jgi:hypothetical protein
MSNIHRLPVNSERFQESWNDHARTMHSLWHSLPPFSPECQRLHACIEEFKELIQIATEHTFNADGSIKSN